MFYLLFQKFAAKSDKFTHNIFFLSYPYGYRKGFNSQYDLISLIERWQKSLDIKGYGSAVLMDLTKAFSTLNKTY